MKRAKTILITGATDGIGLETACRLGAAGHQLLLHGRSPAKLEAALAEVRASGGEAEGLLADLADLTAAGRLADEVAGKVGRLDVLINNAGVFKTPQPRTPAGLDVRFVVNTLAPWLLTRKLLPLIPADGRVVNLSSAAQAPVDLEALAGRRVIGDDFQAYAQSKLAITMWSRHLAAELGHRPLVVAVNPGSLLATKMVREGFGMAGKDLGIGADVLCRAALADEFAEASGCYFDNDSGRFADPHPDALDAEKCAALVQAMERLLAD